jgi:hypothetical protein
MTSREGPCYSLFIVSKGTGAGILVLLALGGSVLGAETTGLWDKTVNLSGAFGYKDNILLSKAQKDESPFWQTGAEFSIFRLPLDGTSVNLFGQFQDRRYFSSSVDKEETAFANATISHNFQERWEIGFESQYSYFDQVLDATVQDFELRSVRVVGHVFAETPFVVRHLPWDSWVRLEFLGERDLYEPPVEPFWQYGPKVIFGKDFRNGSSASVSYFWRRALFDNRSQRALDFTRIPGTELEFRQQEVEAQVRINWDEKKHWRSRFRAAWRLNEDNGPGFYDYNRYKIAKRIGYFAKTWNISLENSALYYDYDVQPLFSGSGIVRRLNDVINLRVEKNLTSALKLFFENEHEWNLSNERLDQYEVNTVMGGVDWGF